MTARGAPDDDVLRRVRIPFVQRATLVHAGGSEQLFCVDLGLAGAFVERPQPLDPGAVVTLTFGLPGNVLPVTVRCHVAWRHDPGGERSHRERPPGLGLAFEEMGEGDRERLRRHLAEHLDQHPRHRRFARPWPGSGEEAR